jgi:MFS family permease
VQSFTLVLVFNGILAGCGVGTVYGAPMKFISGMFHEKRGMALGFLVGGFGLLPFITAPISKSPINRLGVGSAFIALGIVFLVPIPLLGWSFNRPGEYRRKAYEWKKKNTRKFWRLSNNRSFSAFGYVSS